MRPPRATRRRFEYYYYCRCIISPISASAPWFLPKLAMKERMCVFGQSERPIPNLERKLTKAVEQNPYQNLLLANVHEIEKQEGCTTFSLGILPPVLAGKSFLLLLPPPPISDSLSVHHDARRANKDRALICCVFVTGTRQKPRGHGLCQHTKPPPSARVRSFAI